MRACLVKNLDVVPELIPEGFSFLASDELDSSGVVVSTLAQGVPIGGELDYLDDGTISAALKARKTF